MQMSSGFCVELGHSASDFSSQVLGSSPCGKAESLYLMGLSGLGEKPGYSQKDLQDNETSVSHLEV